MGASLDGRSLPPGRRRRWWALLRVAERRVMWTAVSILALTLLGAAYYVGYWEIPPEVVKEAPENRRPALEAQARLAAVQALAGIVVGIGAAFAIRTLWLTREGQITDRFNAAAELLGSKETSARIAAIHALGRVARDSRGDHPAVMTLLGDHLRAAHPAPAQDEAPPAGHGAHPEVKAVALVLRRRRARYDAFGDTLDLSGIDWRDAPLSGANLESAEFRSANLTGAFLRGARLRGANFTDASLKESKLEQADLEGAILENTRLEFARAVSANLQKARMGAATVNTQTNFYGADLRESTGLTVEQMKLVQTDPKAQLPAA